VAISNNEIPGVIIDFPKILRISANVAESFGSSEKSFKSKIVRSSVRIDFTEILAMTETVSVIASGSSSM
jgi:hypothetical protein